MRDANASAHPGFVSSLLLFRWRLLCARPVGDASVRIMSHTEKFVLQVFQIHFQFLEELTSPLVICLELCGWCGCWHRQDSSFIEQRELGYGEIPRMLATMLTPVTGDAGASAQRTRHSSRVRRAQKYE